MENRKGKPSFFPAGVGTARSPGTKGMGLLGEYFSQVGSFKKEFGRFIAFHGGNVEPPR